MKTPRTEEQLGRIYQFLILLHVVAALVAVMVGLAVAHRARPERPAPDRSTFERETPHISDWPTHGQRFPRG